MTTFETYIRTDFDDSKKNYHIIKAYVKYTYQFRVEGGTTNYKCSCKTPITILKDNNICHLNMMPTTSEIIEFKIKFLDNYQIKYIYKPTKHNIELFQHINKEKKMDVYIVTGEKPFVCINNNAYYQPNTKQKIRRFILF